MLICCSPGPLEPLDPLPWAAPQAAESPRPVPASSRFFDAVAVLVQAAALAGFFVAAGLSQTSPTAAAVVGVSAVVCGAGSVWYLARRRTDKLVAAPLIAAGPEILTRIGDDAVETRTPGGLTVQPWSEFAGYRLLTAAVLLFPADQAAPPCVLPANLFRSRDDWEHLMALLPWKFPDD